MAPIPGQTAPAPAAEKATAAVHKDPVPAAPPQSPVREEMTDNAAASPPAAIPPPADTAKTTFTTTDNSNMPASRPDTAAPDSRPKRPVSLSLAALAGYEIGLRSPAPGRVSGSLRLLWHFSPRMAVGLQPAFRYGNVADYTLSDPKAYQRTTTDIDQFTSLDQSPSLRGVVDTLYHYVIRESFDSIVVGGSSIGGRLAEFELPIIFSYKPARSWHVYGGPSLNFGGLLTSRQSTFDSYTTVRKDSIVQSVRMHPNDFINYFGKSSLEPYENRQPDPVVKDPASIRFGYLLGAGYEWKRVIADVSIHQQLSGYEDVIEPVRNVYSSPYLRFSIGYFLFPQKKTSTSAAE
jgi:hypothetical protein